MVFGRKHYSRHSCIHVHVPTLMGLKRMCSVSRFARYKVMLRCTSSLRLFRLRYVSATVACTFSGSANGCCRSVTRGADVSLRIRSTTRACKRKAALECLRLRDEILSHSLPLSTDYRYILFVIRTRSIKKLINGIP